MPIGIYPRKSKSILERFEKYFTKSRGCWEWKGRISSFGYGQFAITWGDTWQAHRLSFKLYKGEDPGKLCVCHTCDNRKCVNPKHLWLGTRKDNVQDMIRKGRALKASPEKNGGAKVDWSTIRRIRAMSSLYPQKDIAKAVGLSRWQIRRITKGISWKE